MHVMIVDSDEAYSRSLKRILIGRGHEVDFFSDPLAACEFIDQIDRTAFLTAKDMPDAVVLDYVLPHLTGFQMLGRVGDLLKPSCRILFVTQCPEQLENANLKEMGIMGCMQKPVDMEILVRVLEGKARNQKTIGEPHPTKPVCFVRSRRTE
jgi:DNA-binding response OmpR family regulator